MIKNIRNFMTKHAAMILCGVSVLVIPLITQECQIIWFQEEEPNGMEEFLIGKKG